MRENTELDKEVAEGDKTKSQLERELQAGGMYELRSHKARSWGHYMLLIYVRDLLKEVISYISMFTDDAKLIRM